VEEVYSGNSMFRVSWRYHNIREGGVTKSDKDTATGGVHQQEFGWRQTDYLFILISSVFSGMKLKVHLQQIYLI
jgi:hypothetical protein